MSIRNEHRYLLKRIRNILAPVIPVLIICGLLCFYCLHSLEKTIIEDCSALSRSTEETINSRFYELRRFVKSIEISGTNSTLKNKDEITKVTEDMYRLSSRIMDFLNTNSLCDKMYIYYPKIDYTVSGLGCFPSSSYYSLQSLPESSLPDAENYEKWKGFLLKPHSGELAEIELSADPKLCYIDSITKNDDPIAVLVIEINKDELRTILSSYSEPSNYTSGLFLNGKPVVTTGNESLLTKEISEHVRSSEGISTKKSNGNYLFYSSSSFPNLAYLSVYTSQGLLRSMLIVSRVCIIGLISCLIIILILSFFIGHKQTVSIQRILKKVSSESRIPPADEYTFISRKIDMMISEKYQSEQKAREYQARLSSLFLTSLLQNKDRSEAELFSIEEQYGISFDYTQYQIAILSGEVDLATAEQKGLSLQEAGSAADLDCIISYTADSFIILFNYDKMDPPIDLSVKALADTAFPDKPAKAGIGLNKDRINQVEESYREALAALLLSEPDKNHPVNLFRKSDLPEMDVLQENETKSSARSFREASIANSARAYVDENYRDHLLGLYCVADYLGVSNSYLSSAFKNTFSIGIIQYLNKLRIEEAKKLILKTDKNIKEIAEIVGFSSDMNFIRVFKKYENTTPSALRKAKHL